MDGDTAFWDAVDALRAQRKRYAREAYGFVVAALGHTVRALPAARRDDPTTRHLSGGELLAGVVGLARTEFGPLAPMVFREWGVIAGEDVGEIVFELVTCGQLSARPEDTIADFQEGALLERLGAEGAAPGPGPGRTRQTEG
jgi:uncharacterized repeat protein (TIGR04138 family)